MKVFVFEYVCGGGWPRGNLRRALAAEGGAMLRALCEDFCRLPDVEVTTTLDSRCRLDLPASVQVVTVDSRTRAREELFHLAIRADATVVIAPELENILARSVRELREAGATVIAPPEGWIELCSDKRQLAGFLSFAGIPTIPTAPLEQHEPHHLSSDWAVIKPAFGAGSQSISVIPADEVEKLRSPPHTPPLEQLIVQPLIPGQAVSVGSMANSLQERVVFPVAQQILSDDGYLQYEGGVVPWSGAGARRIQQIVRRCYERMPELEGYIGFDFVVPDADPAEPLLVEINPRLCTSYLGYRQLTEDNLARHSLPNWPKSCIVWKEQTVRFQPDGSFQVTPLPEGLPCR